MYVALLHYKASPEEVDLLLPDHSEWINQHYRSGDFIAAGRRQPRTAGFIIIARAMLMVEPPSIDGNELTDKGYINQRAGLERRAALVERLYAEKPDDDVIVLR